jgi:hypothetical protein
VRYRRKDGSGNVTYTAVHLGRREEFVDISEVEQCRTRFMQIVNPRSALRQFEDYVG